METRIHEIADGVYRLSTFVPEVSPDGFTFNQFLVTADEPMLFHAGHRQMFPLISEAVGRILPVERLRWIGFGHVEADECGAMNAWLSAAPNASVVHGRLACDVSLNDLCDRPPRALADGEVLDLGGKRMRWLDTPHTPHGWEAGVFFEETAETLFCTCADARLVVQRRHGRRAERAGGLLRPRPGGVALAAFGPAVGDPMVAAEVARLDDVTVTRAARPHRAPGPHGQPGEAEQDRAHDGDHRDRRGGEQGQHRADGDGGDGRQSSRDRSEPAEGRTRSGGEVLSHDAPQRAPAEPKNP